MRKGAILNRIKGRNISAGYPLQIGGIRTFCAVTVHLLPDGRRIEYSAGVSRPPRGIRVSGENHKVGGAGRGAESRRQTSWRDILYVSALPGVRDGAKKITRKLPIRVVDNGWAVGAFSERVFHDAAARMLQMVDETIGQSVRVNPDQWPGELGRQVPDVGRHAGTPFGDLHNQPLAAAPAVGDGNQQTKREDEADRSPYLVGVAAHDRAFMRRMHHHRDQMIEQDDDGEDQHDVGVHRRHCFKDDRRRPYAVARQHAVIRTRFVVEERKIAVIENMFKP